MSEVTLTGVVVSDSGGSAASSKKSNSKQKPNVPRNVSKTWGIIILVCILGLGIFSWYKFNQASKAIDAAPPVLGGNQSVQSQLQSYDSQIASSSNRQTKGLLDMEAADVAFNNSMAPTALAYALRADQIFRTADSSDLVGHIYLSEGNTSRAVYYFKKAANEVPPRQHSGHTSQYYLNEAQAASLAGN